MGGTPETYFRLVVTSYGHTSDSRTSDSRALGGDTHVVDEDAEPREVK